jgi:hypothetical protein
VSQDRQLKMLCEHELEKGEDAPMSVAAHPEVCHATSAPLNKVLKFYRAEALLVGSIALNSTWRRMKMRIAGYFPLANLEIRVFGRIYVYS